MLGIIGAMDQEVNAILTNLKEEKLNEFYTLKFWEGKLNGMSCVVGQSGIGKVNAARCTQIMIDKFSPTSIINVGSAGALNPELEIGDVVISTSCVYHDADLTAFGHPKGYIPGTEDRFIKADEKLIDSCKKAMGKILNNDYKILLGAVATGDQFYNDPEVKAELYKEFGAYCDDMEAAAIAHVCYLCKVPFVVVRSISDKPTSKDKVDFYDFLELASKRCAEFLSVLVST